MRVNVRLTGHLSILG